MAQQLNRKINTAFKRHGLSLRGDAFSALRGFFLEVDEKEQPINDILTHIISSIKRQELTSSFVSEAMIITALESHSNHSSQQLPGEGIQILDAFSTPKLFYNSVRRTFNIVPHNTPLHGNAQDKAAIFRDRWNLLYQRLLRNELFSPPTITKGAAARKSYYQITHIESLIGSTGSKCIFGFLTQIEEGRWYIEDHNSHVRIDISNCTITEGLFTENCIVLCEGVLQNSVFVCSTMGFPPPERRQDTLNTFPLLASLGSTESATASQRTQLDLKLRERKDDMVVVLSDVHLDSPRVLSKLTVLFSAFEDSPPPLFVLLGNFTSKPYAPGVGRMAWLRKCYDDFADIIARFPHLNATKFVHHLFLSFLAHSEAYCTCLLCPYLKYC